MTGLFSKLNSNSLVLVLLPIILIPVVFYDTTLAMVHVWTVNETFTHGFLVFPFVLWLTWKKRSQILKMQPHPEPWGFLLLLLFLTGWLVSAVVDVKVAQQFSMITIILTTVLIVAGRQIFLYMFYPLLFLYFAVPFGQVLIPPLMQFTADFTVALIKMVGIPVYRDGYSFTLPTGSWSVVEECSGVRYLIASFLLGSIYAYLNYSSIKKRVFFILLSLIVPVVGNGLRAFGIVMIGHFSGMRLAIGADHLLYGWVFFGAIIFLLFYVGSFWRDTEASFTSVSNDEIKASTNKKKKASALAFFAITFFSMVSFSAYSIHVENEKEKAVKSVTFELPDNFSGWRYDAGRLFDWQPVVVNPDAKVSRGYYSGEAFVQLDIAYYQIQRQGAEAISTNNKLTNPHGGDWKLVSATEIVEDDKDFIESELKYADKKLLVWSWYRVGRYETASPYMAKVLEAYSLIFEGRSDVSKLSIATWFDDSEKITRHKIYDFWRKSYRGVTEEFERIRNGKQD